MLGSCFWSSFSVYLSMTSPRVAGYQELSLNKQIDKNCIVAIMESEARSPWHHPYSQHQCAQQAT